MNRARTIGLTAAAFMTCASGIAAAGTITQVRTNTVAKGLSFTQTFAGFVPGTTINGVLIPVGAVLTDVTDTFSDTLTGSITLTNNGATGTFSLALVDTATKTIGGLTLTTSVTGAPIFAGTLAGGATSTASQSGTGSTVQTSTGAGFLTPTVIASITTGLSRSGAVHFPNTEVDAGTGVFVDTLQYNFSTPTPAVPEPATLTLLGSGLVGLGLARRARRRRKQ